MILLEEEINPSSKKKQWAHKDCDKKAIYYQVETRLARKIIFKPPITSNKRN